MCSLMEKLILSFASLCALIGFFGVVLPWLQKEWAEARHERWLKRTKREDEEWQRESERKVEERKRKSAEPNRDPD